MLEAKEQAKYYIDKIRSAGKTANQTLLIVFIPLTFLWISTIESKYTVAEDWIKHKEAVDEIKEQKLDSQNHIANINASITAYLNDTAKRNYKGLKEKGSKIVADYIKGKKEIKYGINQQLKEGGRKKSIFNDSIQNNLNKLQIPVTLPILNIKIENLYFKYIIFLVMFFYASVLFYGYLMKSKIATTLQKFVQIIEKKFSIDNKDLYTDYDFNLPFWFFPIKIRKMDKEQITLIKIIGIDRQRLHYSNIIIYLLSAGFLLANIRLLIINWNLNFKVFHSHYSFVNGFCFLLLFADLIIIILLLKPVRYQSEENQELEKSINSRKQFIKQTLVIAASSFFIEPIYNKISKGNKWYHVPRFIPEPTQKTNFVRKGLYANKKKSNKGIYYFNKDGKSPCLKTKADKNKFLEKIVRINTNDLINSKIYLKRIREKELLQYINEKNVLEKEKIPLLTKYMDVAKLPLSAEFIDTFTKVFAEENLYGSKYKEILPVIQDRVRVLKEQYAATYKNNSSKIKNIVIQRNVKRFETWENRIKHKSI